MNTPTQGQATAQDLLDLQRWEQQKGFVSTPARHPKPSPPKPSRPRYSQPRRCAKTKQGRPLCPVCASDWARKNGGRKGRPDNQKWKCVDCGRRFTQHIET